eukprot:8887737-Pyramimonas_sp.AAC.1
MKETTARQQPPEVRILKYLLVSPPRPFASLRNFHQKVKLSPKKCFFPFTVPRGPAALVLSPLGRKQGTSGGH